MGSAGGHGLGTRSGCFAQESLTPGSNECQGFCHSGRIQFVNILLKKLGVPLMKLPRLHFTRQSHLGPENAPIRPLPTAAPISCLHPDYFITICLRAGIALLKPQIIIITIIRNSCGGGIGTPSENVWVCPLAMESLLLSSGTTRHEGSTKAS